MKKSFLPFSVIFVFSLLQALNTSAQTPSELRRMKQQTDSSGNTSQSHQSASDRHRSKEQKNQDEKVFGDEDNMFTNSTVPDKWKNESAVILGLKVSYNYYSKAGDVCDLDETIRERIKLMDKAAIDDYSFFYFTTSGVMNNVGFRIVKKDGTTNVIDLSKAVDVESSDDVPEYEALYGGYSAVRYKKIAMSNLEPGDIIDYYYTFNFAVQRTGKAVEYPAQILRMSQSFPTLAQKVDFQVERGFYINFASYNGAPELVQKEDINHRIKSFSFADNDREKEKSERFVYSYRTDPTIKFQVVYTSESQKDDVPFFLGKPLVPLSQATPDMVQKVASHIALEDNSTADDDASAIIKYMREKHKDVTDNVEYMQDAYYYFRYLTLIKPALTKYQFDNQYTSGTYGNTPLYWESQRDNILNGKISDEFFVKTMGAVCREKKIDYDFLFTVPRNIGTLDNLLLTDEMRWVLRIKGIPETYLYPFDRHTDPNEAIGTVEGADAYVIVPNKNSRATKFDRQGIPVSKCTDNTYSYNMDVTFNAAMDGGAAIKRSVVVQGLPKNYYLPEVLVEDDYENLDIKRYRTNAHDEMTDDEAITKIHSKKDHDEAVRKTKASMDDQLQKRLDRMKAFAEVDFTIDSYDYFNLLADGREKDSTDLIFNESFKIKDIIKKVGPNYIANVGMLIGKTVNIKDTELQRNYDVYMDYPQTTSNQIVVNIPDGYKVEGIDKLNVNITNSTGGFISTTILNGNKLTIKTQEYWTSNFLPKSSWPDMVKFMRAAYDFTQQKILLKKA